jgi:hypothetical protein
MQADVQDAIEELIDEGYSPKQIEEKLQGRIDADQLKGPLPNLRTIQRIVAERPNDSTAWEIEPAGEIDPRDAFAVLSEVVTRTGGRVSQLSKLEARWVTALLALRGDTPAWEVYRLARLYILRRQAKLTTADLDAFLVFAPWIESHVEAYIDAILDGRIPAPPVFLQDLITDKAGGIKVLADWLDGEPRRIDLRKLIRGLPEETKIKQWLAQREGVQDEPKG